MKVKFTGRAFSGTLGVGHGWVGRWKENDGGTSRNAIALSGTEGGTGPPVDAAAPLPDSHTGSDATLDVIRHAQQLLKDFQPPQSPEVDSPPPHPLSDSDSDIQPPDVDFPPPYPLSDSDSDTEGSTGPPVDGRVVLLSDSDTEGGGRPAVPPGDVVVLLSDSASEDSCSEGGTANAGFLNKQNGKLPMVSEHPFAERQDRHVFGDALSRLLEVFPGVCRDTAAADLSSQLKTASPETALDEIVGRYLGQGVPMAETVPQEKPKPDLPRVIGHPMKKRVKRNEHGVGTSTGIRRVENRVDMGSEVPTGGIECGCCCSDSVRFEEMVQCADGHLFCFTCIRRRVEESTFGGAQAGTSLPCMDTGGCRVFIPRSEVKRALPPDVLATYERRQARDAVLQANIPGLVFCPFCDAAYDIAPDLRVMECGSCKKASCVDCRAPSHIPLRCEDVEKGSATASRRSIEERMTGALLRVCAVCKAELLKDGGCNKVMCRCGQSMCYACRQPIADTYAHFCMHDSFRNTGKGCTNCKKCGLWEHEDEHEVVGAARESAMEELAQGDPNLLKRTIGPTLEKVPRKRPRFPAP